MTINTSPTSADLGQIEIWLKAEFDSTTEGFYCNWETVQQAFQNDGLITYSSGDSIIGFICWSDYDTIYVDLDIMEIHPNFRGEGHGSQFYNLVEAYFKEYDYLVIKLFCSPASSELFWKKMHFIKFPDRGYTENPLTYYKPFIKVNQVQKEKSKNRVELWNKEPYLVSNQEPTWIWNISDNSSPILQPVNGNWNIKLIKDEILVKQSKVKHFDYSKEVCIGPFLYLETAGY